MNNHLESLKIILKNLNLDFFLLPNSDEFLSEYLPEYAKRLQFITGFTGSNAFTIISTKGKSAFFTDGRYTLQASTQVDKKQFDISNLAEILPLQWLLKNTVKNSQIGFDPSLHSINSILNYQKYFGENLISLEQNPIDKIWKNQPKPPKTRIFQHQKKYCGLSSKEKIALILKDLNQKSDAVILTNPASICWLFNIRASDVEYSPLHLRYAIVYRDGNSELFTNRLMRFARNDDVKSSLEKFSTSSLRRALDAQQSNLVAKDYSINLDFNQANYQLYQTLKSQNVNIINQTDPCLIHKAIKNPIEIKNAHKAHKLDGLAMTKFLFWLENAVNKKANLDEIKIAEKLLEFRKANKEFLYESFATIAGFASNGAIIHYHATKKTNKKIKGNGLLLIDSGGQYFEGTTDITRTIAVGVSTQEMIENFTRVLKGQIALARAKFPIGTSGFQLDSLARFHLWQAGLDYAHGTGHGVGSFSSVHESPPSISKKNDGVALQAGMILSNEPGYYKEGEYGIRIENLILVEKFNDKFLHFKTLTVAPIDHRLIDFKMLTYPEKKWLKEYHQKIYNELKNKLSKPEKTWLENIVKTYQINK
jgi:Xaa-Pro aminopeptidase